MKKVISIFLCLALCLGLLPGTAAAADVTGVLDFTSPSTDVSDTAKGYSWDANAKTLTLAEGFNAATVTLPDDTVTINTTGNSIIDQLAFQNDETINLTFAGEGTLTVNQQINIASGDYNILIVNNNANVIANGGIYIGESGGTNSIITVNGTLTARGDTGIAIQAGSVAIGDTGTLTVSGTQGVLLGGMPRNTGAAYNNLFTVEGNGCFTANCSAYNLQVLSTSADGFPKDAKGGIDAGKVIALTSEYLPEDCEAGAAIGAGSVTINLVKKSTGEIYKDALTIHKNHKWSDTDWAHNDTHHWRPCIYAGCDWKQPDTYQAHSLKWESNGTNYWQKCTVCGWEDADHTAHKHTPSAQWQHNTSEHWKTCTDGCGWETAHVQHVYDDSADTVCNTCGYTRVIGCVDCPSRAFTDLGGVGTWYHEAVDYALRNGLMDGYGGGLFGPDDDLSRAQLTQILYNKEGKPAVRDKSVFVDVASGVWFTPAVTWASMRDIVVGYGNGLFGPDDPITREQLAAMLWRYAGRPASAEKNLDFADTEEISDYALEAVAWAVEQGIMQGSGNGILDPRGNATRAEVATMLMRLRY